MPTFTHPIVVEALEARIAPAQFFLSGTALTAEGAAGDVNKGAAAMSVGANLAVLLGEGDTLVLDTNGNKQLDDGEVVYASVDNGSAMVFVTDLNQDLSVDAEEITGVAVSDKFDGVINGDVHGSIVTLLKTDGSIDAEDLQASSISGLVVTGRIFGDLRAGEDIANVKIGETATGSDLGVQRILAGKAMNLSRFSLNGGTVEFIAEFDQGFMGAAGANITNVTVFKGVAGIEAGRGGYSVAGNGGAGGNIDQLTLLDAPAEFVIRAGNGGESDGKGKAGGAGGTVSNVELTLTSDSDDVVIQEPGQPFWSGIIEAGNGGEGPGGGGAGGHLRNVMMDFKVDALHWFHLSAGYGGSAVGGDNPTGRGGDGGSILNSHVVGAGKIDWVGFGAGNGGDAGYKGNSRGGNGGSVLNSTAKVLGGARGPSASAGYGGNGAGWGNGGNGGALMNLRFDIGDTEQGFGFGSGWGGGGEFGNGGLGGAVKSVHITATSAAGGQIYVVSGGGGGSEYGRGVAAGNVTDVTLEVTGFSNAGLGIFGGSGGGGDTGGRGGNITNASISVAGTGAETLIVSGDGGRGGTSNGGASGKIANARITNTMGDAESFLIQTGAGGSSSFRNGGRAGSITNVEIDIAGGAASKVSILGGIGGGGMKAGQGGSLSNLKISAANALTDQAEISCGNGGAGVFRGGNGGNSGSIHNLTLDLPGSLVFINAGSYAGVRGGFSGDNANDVGGNGGSVSGIKGHVGTLVLAAPNGGYGEGRGGNGGSITRVNLTEVDNFVRLIRAGDGGGSASRPGTGGNLSGIHVAGDIGDFTSSFGIKTDANEGMGGLIAGQAGGTSDTIPLRKNGSISNVTADRIAAILAGAPTASGIDRFNAVISISSLKGVTKVGADVDGNTAFDFTDVGSLGYNFGDGDTALDGLVVVFKNGYKSNVTPLKLIKITNS